MTNNYFCLQQNVNRKCPVTKLEPVWTIKCIDCPSIIQFKNLHVRNTNLRNSIEKYGINNFNFDILVTIKNNLFTQELLNNLEVEYIKYYDATNMKYGYNKNTGGAYGLMTEDVKHKM